MNLFQQIKFALSKPPRGQIKFIVTTYIDNKISKRFYGKSLTGNFLQLWYTMCAYNDSADFQASGAPWSSLTTTKDITNTSRSVYNVIAILANANPGSVASGLICGTGTTTPASADYKVETIIAHGTGAGQFSYQQQTSTQGCVIDTLTTSFILQRLFVNSSGGQIDVNEICLYTAYSSWSFCLYRDVLSSADEIPDGSTYRVTLEISVTT
jgi:hypothetical protein